MPSTGCCVCPFRPGTDSVSPLLAEAHPDSIDQIQLQSHHLFLLGMVKVYLASAPIHAIEIQMLNGGAVMVTLEPVQVNPLSCTSALCGHFTKEKKYQNTATAQVLMACT